MRHTQPAATCEPEIPTAAVERARVIAYARARAARFHALRERETHDHAAAMKWFASESILLDFANAIDRGEHENECPPVQAPCVRHGRKARTP